MATMKVIVDHKDWGELERDKNRWTWYYPGHKIKFSNRLDAEGVRDWIAVRLDTVPGSVVFEVQKSRP